MAEQLILIPRRYIQNLPEQLWIQNWVVVETTKKYNRLKAEK